MENYYVPYLIVVLITLAALAATYIIHFHSAIGPGFIEFDGANRREMKIMYIYNSYFDNAYKFHMIIIGAGLFTGLLFENIGILMAVMIFQAIYIALGTSCMVLMFVRSKIYWGL